MAAITTMAQLIANLVELAANDYGAVTMDLYQNDVTPTEGSILADFTVADFSGYAQETALNFGAPFVNLDGYAEMDLPSVQFDHSGGATANMIYGFYIQKTGGGLLYAERLPTAPIPMVTSLNALVILSRYIMQNSL